MIRGVEARLRFVFAIHALVVADPTKGGPESTVANKYGNNGFKLTLADLPAPYNHTSKELANPNCQTGCGIVVGAGAAKIIGVNAGSSVVVIGSNVYGRITKTDINNTSTSNSGLHRQENKRLVWFLKKLDIPDEDRIAIGQFVMEGLDG